MLNLLLAIDTEALKKALEISWKGMLAVVVVVGIIIAVTYLMLFISRKSAEKKKKKENASKTE